MVEEALKYFHGDELAAQVFIDKYALKDNQGNLLEQTPDDMHKRIAKELARIEKNKFKIPLSEDDIYYYLKDFRYIIPQGSPMFGIGNPHQLSTLANCYVLESPCDSYGGIMNTDEQLVQISKRRGGVGLDISYLRPAGTHTNNAARSSTGIIAFMARYSNSIREVGQSGRRGALMITISIHHPQILDFVRSKLDNTKITGANISVRLSDEFLEAVSKNETYQQRWPIDADKPEIINWVDANTIWLEIIKCARDTSEPGLLFWDRIIQESPADCYKQFGYETSSTNPCAEIPLCTLDCCRLLLLNIYSYVNNPFLPYAEFDFVKFGQHCQIAQRFMDDIIDLELECLDRILNKIEQDPEPIKIKIKELELWKKIKEKCIQGRRTGTGITALGDCLAALGIKYGSEESIQTTEQIYRTLKLNCYRSSVDMAKQTGPFPVWNKELEQNNPFLLRIKEEDLQLYEDMQRYGRKNIAINTTPPAGSTSILTRTTSGIEPLFQISYVRRKKINYDETTKPDFVDQNGDKWKEFTVYHPKIEEWKKNTGNTDVRESPYFGCCAEDLDWPERVKLQAAAQRHIDHSISSTLNLPENITIEQVGKIYEEAWLSGCKGVTIYRKNSRTGILIDKGQNITKIIQRDAPKRPNELPCEIFHTKVQNVSYYVLVGLLNNDPYECFVAKNMDEAIPFSIKSGTLIKMKRGTYQLKQGNLVICENIMRDVGDHVEALTRMISTALRHGSSVKFVVHQLGKVKGDLNSFAKCIGRALKKYVEDGTKITGESCPSCQSENLIRECGCINCTCGWSKCA